MPDPSPDLEFKTAVIDLKKATDEVKKFAETANAEIKNLGKLTEETKVNADKALTDMGLLTTRLADIEQKMTRRGGSGGHETKTLGQIVVENEEVKAAMTSGNQHFKARVTIETKDITSASTTGTSATTGLVVADRRPIVNLPDRKMTIRDLLMPGTTASAAIEYPKELVFTNAAAPVTEDPTLPKPQSNITFTLVNTPVRTIAHFIMASKQILADAPMLQSYIDGRLRYGLAYAEELQLLSGDGTGVNLLGLIPQATTYALPSGLTITAATYIDTMRAAMLQAALALYPATGHVLNPVDWANIQLTKDSQNRYIFSDPQGNGSQMMWGLPVVDSLAMPQNHFLTGAFKMAAQIFDRETADVLISTEDRDNFVRNMITILCEERLALAVYRPAALITGKLLSTGP